MLKKSVVENTVQFLKDILVEGWYDDKDAPFDVDTIERLEYDCANAAVADNVQITDGTAYFYWNDNAEFETGSDVARVHAFTQSSVDADRFDLVDSAVVLYMAGNSALRGLNAVCANAGTATGEAVDHRVVFSSMLTRGDRVILTAEDALKYARLLTTLSGMVDR